MRKLCGGATRASSRGVSASAAAAQHTCGSPASPAHTLHLRHHARHYPLPLAATARDLPPRTPHPSPRSPGRELLVGLGLHLLGGQFRVHGGVAEKPRPGTYFLKFKRFV